MMKQRKSTHEYLRGLADDFEQDPEVIEIDEVVYWLRRAANELEKTVDNSQNGRQQNH